MSRNQVDALDALCARHGLDDQARAAVERLLEQTLAGTLAVDGTGEPDTAGPSSVLEVLARDTDSTRSV